MENFEYYNPVKVVFGEGVLNQVGTYAAAYGKKAMLVTYTECDFFAETIEAIYESLEKAGVSCIVFKGVTANPRTSQAKRGVELCKENDIDLLIGLGGGSVIDCTKVIAAGVFYEHDIAKMLMLSHSDVTAIPPTKALPYIAIPTLAGTGSEMNPIGVVTDDASGQKSYVWEPGCLYAKAAIMDPTLTTGLPPYQTACGGIDIVAHVMEAYINGDPDTNLTLHNRMQEGVMRATFEALEQVWENPGDVQARGVMMWAATVALNGWMTSGTFGFTPMHQMGHVLSARYNATHGATLTCMMISWMKYFETRSDNQKYVMLAENVFGCSLHEAWQKLEKLAIAKGVQTRISEFGATEADLDSLTDEVVSVSFGPDGLLNGHPKMSREDIYQCYKLAL
ncbi:MAG: iron-containing alcohol dehydrogenase [Lachnospiraceae bacterium]|nr:iron-containing alcohol dehydrogenase [Lachnospiraceae bacterium]